MSTSPRRISTRAASSGPGRQYVDVVDRVSIAANLNDSALRFADLVHRASRAGRPNPTELDAEQTGFMVEASRKPGLRPDPRRPERHSQAAAALARVLVRRPVGQQRPAGAVAAERRRRRGAAWRRRARSSGARYWTFPPDFERPRGAAVRAARRPARRRPGRRRRPRQRPAYPLSSAGRPQAAPLRSTACRARRRLPCPCRGRACTTSPRSITRYWSASSSAKS